MKSSSIGRRRFLSRLLVSGAALAVPIRFARAQQFEAPDDFEADLSPIEFLSGLPGNSADFNGDQMDHPHEVLWDKDNWLRAHGGIPEPTETAPVVVIGGGMAGLLAAYQLRGHGPVLFEQASRLGGNAKGEAFGEGDSASVYALGAAYITKPEPGSPIEQLLTDLGLHGLAREDAGSSGGGDVVLANGRLVAGFWTGATDPANAAEFTRVRQALEDVRVNHYPRIPFDSSSQLTFEELLKLDSMTFAQWVQTTLGAIHPHIDEYFHHYCWSSLAGDCDELSAAQVLSFLAGDLGGTLALPGGNAAIARELWRRLDPGTARAGALVIDVALVEGGVRVCYEQAGAVKSILAKACIMAAPKFVAKGLISTHDLPRPQFEAMDHLKYRAYIVANVLLKGKVASPGYDIFRLTGTVPHYPRHDIEERGFTDVVFGAWAANDHDEHSVLTIYRPLPWDGARQLLFNPDAHDKHRALIMKDLPELFHALGLDPAQIGAVRMTRWGHAIPVAWNGLLASGVPMAASQPIGGRIFFAGQDCWASACFETAVETAAQAAAAVVSLI